MPPALIWTAAALLVATFLWAATAKAVGFRAWKRALALYRVPQGIQPLVAPAVPAVELACAAAILFLSIKAGAALALFLVAVFCAAILRARSAAGDTLPCGCFGGDEERDYRAMLLRNGLLGAACGVVLIGSQEGALVTSVEAPSGSEILPLVLVGAGVAVASWMVRQAMGSMHRRGHS
jgi:hypothetical protein